MKIKVGDCTPWGTAQTVKDCGGGIYKVGTAGHGGIYVPDEMLVRISEREKAFAERWSGSRNWYEEDCAAVSVMYHFPELFDGMDAAKVTECWEAIFGEKK